MTATEFKKNLFEMALIICAIAGFFWLIVFIQVNVNPFSKGNTSDLADPANYRIMTDGEVYAVEIRTQYGWRQYEDNISEAGLAKASVSSLIHFSQKMQADNKKRCYNQQIEP